MMKASFTLLLATVVTVMFSVAGAAAQSKSEIQLLPSIRGNSFAPRSGQMLPPDTPSHNFFNAHNVVSMSALTALVAIDGVTTQHLIQDYKFREMNPIARPLVTRGSAGQVAACTMGLGVAVGAAYLFHKRGHYRLEKWTLRLSISAESAAVINNVVKSP
jgi:hypothetical protein